MDSCDGADVGIESFTASGERGKNEEREDACEVMPPPLSACFEAACLSEEGKVPERSFSFSEPLSSESESTESASPLIDCSVGAEVGGSIEIEGMLQIRKI